ncbi:hypothetical protein C1141_13910, partial [Vibrio agarivorans]
RYMYITLCDANNSCLNETRFKWKGSSSRDDKFKIKSLGDTQWFIDINKDGWTDLCQKYKDGLVRCSLLSKDRDVDSVEVDFDLKAELNAKADTSWAQWVDVKGNSKPQYCRMLDKELRCYEFEVVSGKGVIKTQKYPMLDMSTKKEWIWAFDFNGDGRPDICRKNSKNQLICSTNKNGKSFSQSHVFDGITWGKSSETWWADIDGNGFQDLCSITNGAKLSCTRFNAGEIVGGKNQIIPITDFGYKERRWWLDVNGDGAEDFCRGTGKKKSGPGSNMTCSLGSLKNISRFDNDIVIKDIDWGQGHQLWLSDRDGKMNFCTTYKSFRNRDILDCKNIFSEWSDHSMGPQIKWIVDLNDDQQLDSCTYIKNDGEVSCGTIGHDKLRLSEVINGLGFKTEIKYAHHKDIGTPQWPEPLSYPYVPSNPNALLVSELRSYKSITGVDPKEYNGVITQYQYGPSRVHMQGEGHSGFAWVKQIQQNTYSMNRGDVNKNDAKGREIHYRTDFPYAQRVKTAKEYLLPSLPDDKKWDFQRYGTLLNQADTEYGSKSTGKNGQLIQISTQQANQALANNEFGYFEQYTYQGKTYLKVPDTFVPIAGEIMVPLLLPSNQVYELTGKSATDNISGSYTIYEAKLVNLNQSQLNHVLPHLKQKSGHWYINDANHDGRLDVANVPQLGKKRLSVFQTKETSKSYGLDGKLLSTVETSHGRFDEYGNIGLVEVKTTGTNPVTLRSETFTQKTESDYSNHPSRWILGRLNQSSVTHIAPNGQQEKRTSRFSYDSVTGFLKEEIIEPGHKLQVIKRYARNAEGEVESSSITGWANAQKGSETRTNKVSKSYRDATVEVRSTNSLGFTSRVVTNRITNKSSKFDINGIESQIESDKFGRTTRSRTQSTSGFIDSFTKYYPTNSNQCSPHTQSLAAYCVINQTAGLGQSIVYYDNLQRELRVATLGQDNKWIYKDTTYNQNGQVHKVSRPYFKGETPQYSITHYDRLGRITSVSEPGPAGEKDSWVRFSYGPFSVTETDALGRKKTTYQNAMGWKIKVVQPEGASIEKTYSPMGKLLKAKGADGATIVNQYDGLGNKIATQDPDLGSWTYQYNAFGELLTQTDAKKQTTSMTYDVLGRMVSRSTQTHSTVNGKKQTSTETENWVYDQYKGQSWKGALVRETKPGYTKNIFYNGLGQVSLEQVMTREHTFSRQFTYNKFGQVKEETRPDAFKLHYDYDSATGINTGVWGTKNQTTTQFSEAEYRQVIQPLINEAAVKARSYLSKAGELSKQIKYYENRAREYQQLKDQVEHLSGGTAEMYTTAYGKALEVFLGPNGERYLKVPDNFVLIAQDIAIPLYAPPAFHLKLEGNTVSKISIEEWKRIESSLTDSNKTVFYGDFDASGQAGITEVPVGRDDPLYDSQMRSQFDRLQHLADEIQRIEFVKNDLHQQATNYIAAASQLVSLAKQTQYIANRFNIMGQDSLKAKGELEDIKNQVAAGRIYYWKLSNLDAEGRISAELYGNGLENLYDYNEATGQLLNITTKSGTKSIRALHYVYDRMDNVKRRTDLINDIDDYYSYDNLDRLSSNTLKGLGGKHRQNPLFNKTYSVAYNRAGNISHKSDVGNYVYADKAHVHAVTKAGSKQYAYDANGNMLSGDGRQFVWNGFNKPTQITKGSQWVKFSYDVNHNRYFKQNQDGDKTWYLGKAYERIDRANGEVEHKQFINGGGKLVAVNVHRKKSNSAGKTASFDRQVRYLHSDALGSHDLVTDTWGNVVDRKSFDAWGKERYFEWQKGPNYFEQDSYVNRGYTGHEQVDEVGLIHMNARMYDATLGRFISADSYVQSPNNSQSFNRYSYVQNNPMKYTDPSGHFLKKLFKKVGRALKKIGGMLKKIGRFVRENAFQIGLMIVGIYAPWVAFAIRTTYATMTGGLRGLVSTLATAALYNVVGSNFPVGSFGSSAWAIKTVAHGVAGGISSVMQGGKFGEGFASAAVAQAFSPYIDETIDDKNLGISGERIAAAAVIGGVTSHLTGGKFANGAAMGAMARMFNDEHALKKAKNTAKNWVLRGEHKYTHFSEAVCLESSSCTREALVDALNTYGTYPGQDKPFIPGQSFMADANIPGPWGEDHINTYAIYDSNGAQIGIQNHTLSNHILHPGYVDRTIVNHNGWFYIKTVGGGSGPFGGINNTLDNLVWGPVNSNVINRFR